MKKILLTSVAVLALLSGCNNDYDGRDIAGSKLVVSASIDQVKTRASDTEWAVNDAIGVSDNLSMNPNLNIKYVAGSTTGNFTSATGIYILGSESVTYTAYYPYSGAEGSSAGEVDFSIIDGSGKYVGSSTIDFMFAQGATATRENPQVNFTFKHMMSKLKLDFKDSGAVGTRADTPISYTLRGVIVDGTFNTADGTVTRGTTKGDVTVNATLGTASSVILPPMVASEEGGTPEEIQLIITVEDKIYSGTFTPALSGSQEYQYSIDLSQTESGEKLQISTPTIDGWTPNDEGNIGVKEEINYNTTLEVGDFFCKDGTIIDKEYDLSQLEEAMKSSIVGVVYYVGNPQPSTLYGYEATVDALKRDYASCTNGLAIAIANAQEVPDRFATAKYSYDTWFKSETNTAVATSYIGTALNTSTAFERMLGYNNTRIMELAVADVNDDAQTGAASFITLLTQYRTANAVTGVSAWYLPSYAELKAIQDNYDAISASIVKVGATLPQYTDFAGTTGTFYWSSDLRGNSYNWVSPLAAVSAETNLFVGRNSSGTKGYFRFAFAF